MNRTDYDDIIDNLKDSLELLSYSGITDIPGLSGSRTVLVSHPPEERIMADAPAPVRPAEWTFIENPEQPFSPSSLTGTDIKVFAFGIWHAGTKLCFIAGENITDSGAEPFSGPTGNQMELIVNWMAGLLKLAPLDSMSRYICYGSGPSDAKEAKDAYAGCGARIKKEIEKNSLRIAVLFGKEACCALLGRMDVKRLRGRFHKSGNLLIMPTWGPVDLLKDTSLKKETKADMLMVVDEAKKTE